MKRERMIISVMLAVFLALTSVVTTPAYATEDSSNDAQTEQTEQAKQTEQKERVSEKRELTEKELIAKYGTYHGKNAKRIPVITYHQVVSDAKKKKAPFKGSSLSVSKSTFEKQMKWLKNHGYRTICCDEFYLWHKGKIKLPKKSVLITFDDGYIGVADYAVPILKKYNMKGTSFIIGKSSLKNKKKSISYKRIQEIHKDYPNFEFQSHTFALHKHWKKKGIYKVTLKDAEKQKKYYNFKYLAYPYGNKCADMIKAYKKSGIKMAFSYGRNGYATRKQSIYKIRRIKISGNSSFSSFKRWFK